MKAWVVSDGWWRVSANLAICSLSPRLSSWVAGAAWSVLQTIHTCPSMLKSVAGVKLPTTEYPGQVLLVQGDQSRTWSGAFG